MGAWPGTVAAHVGIGVVGQIRRQSCVVRWPGHRQDIVLPTILGLHQGSIRAADLLRAVGSATAACWLTDRHAAASVMAPRRRGTWFPADVSAAPVAATYSLPSRHIACMITTSLRATATAALAWHLLFASFSPHVFSAVLPL